MVALGEGAGEIECLSHTSKSEHMSETKVEFLEKWFDILYVHPDESAIHEMFAADGKAYGLGPVLTGPKEFIPVYHGFRDSLAGMRITIEDSLEVGDKLAARCRLEIPNGDQEPLSIEGMCIVRIVDGQMKEAWNAWNFLELLQQQGALPERVFLDAFEGARFVRAEEAGA